MLNIRTVILFSAFAVIFVLTIGLVTVRTEVVPAPSSNPASVLDNQERSASQKNVDNIRFYRSSLGECFDVPLSEASECRNASQAPVQSYRSRLDECFDMSLMELTSCRNVSQASVP